MINVLIKLICIIFIFITIDLYSADRNFFFQSFHRHKEMSSYYQKKEYPTSLWERKYLTGNWNGVRDELSDKGLTITSSYVTDLLGNPFGGEEQGFSYAGSFGMDMTMDFNKITGSEFLGWWYFYVSALWRSGTSLSDKYIKNQFNPAQLYGGETYKLIGLYLRKIAFNEKFSCKLGRLDAGDDFLCSKYYQLWVSNAFCGNPVSVFLNSPLTAYPNATWGAYLDVKPTNKFLARLGVYNTNENISKNKYHGVNFTFKNTHGALLISELVMLVGQDNNTLIYPGNYKVGAYYVTGKTQTFAQDYMKGNYSYYFLLDQMIYKIDDSRGIVPFLALIFAPAKVAMFPFFFTTGITFNGCFGSRDKDSICIGAAYGKYSFDLNKYQMLQGQEKQTYELVLELNYKAYVSKWLFIQPDMQYIIRPKGHRSVPNALVLGAQIGITF